jgi:hypothetical protein
VTTALTHDEAPRADRDAEPRQLDLFVDGRDALLLHEVVTGLLGRDVVRAETGLRRLHQEHPGHVDLGVLTVLVDALTARLPASATHATASATHATASAARAAASTTCAAAPVNHATLTERIEATERALVPGAWRFLGKDAAAFLRPVWQALAATAGHLQFDPAHPRAHRGWLCQQHGEWAEVRAAVEAEPDWAATPLLRYWLGLAQHHLGAHEIAIRLWLPLCWTDPLLFAKHAPTLPNPTIREAWAAFERGARFEESVANTTPTAAWFPAWLVLCHRGLTRLFPADEIPEGGNAARVFRHLLALLPLEQRGLSDELVRQRRALRQIDPDFFRYYMEVVGERRSVQ